MNIIEAARLMMDGAEVSRPPMMAEGDSIAWGGPNNFAGWESGIIIVDDEGNAVDYWCPSTQDLMADDWEVVDDRA